jgi:hypothetical protein
MPVTGIVTRASRHFSSIVSVPFSSPSRSTESALYYTPPLYTSSKFALCGWLW